MRAAIVAWCCVGAVVVSAQGAKTFRARLAPVPIDVAMQTTVAGSGTATGTLNAATLTITGTFEGLKSPATIAQLHKSPIAGVRGPVVADLSVARSGDGTAGTIRGTVTLTAQQVTDLEKKRLYVQVHSEKAPEGNLWGWLAPLENKK
ncbi:MAG TPA: CHRD domain-containing protein [Vicinamibacterales bacterium]